ncbi:sacsin N-terminal ATP-binding-like domain-containing protein [Yoonia vestfoldensis]|uniref:sacsin N-terminal ATP-binding-like domain-containing protein n=1 Tax=Yoonia vestfoldensis TaxID=245188 RepID=UPI0013A549E6|nr:DUF3883 domain-containing protein [Yoonia vestfoldensis]
MSERVANDLVTLPVEPTAVRDMDNGKRAAKSIWDDTDDLDDIVDPRTPEFATAVIEGLAQALSSSPGAVKKVMRGAAAAAEDLNVEQFQGLIEVIQNADDLRATEVRFALRDGSFGKELLIVHNGHPVACQHVLGMALPFLTTKTNRTDQRGRFGIGLKTLKRIAHDLSIHSRPYHFSGDQLTLRVVGAEAALPGFYDPAGDTLFVLELKDDFEESDLQAWFETWDDHGLVFLGSVSRFVWCDLSGETLNERSLVFEPWKSVEPTPAFEKSLKLENRVVKGAQCEWTVWRAQLQVPEELHPAHKARSNTTYISIAAPTHALEGHLYIGFKTRIPVELPFSIDAQFDPSTAREALIENPWNGWLIARCGDVLAEIAYHALLKDPVKAWYLVPLKSEHIGTEADRWLRRTFDASFEATRQVLGKQGVIQLSGDPVPLDRIAYESDELTSLLSASDIKLLSEGMDALPLTLRGTGSRWRSALGQIGVSLRIGTAELLAGFGKRLFIEKAPEWWVSADRILVESHSDDEIFGVPIWLSNDLRALPSYRIGTTAKPLILGGVVSPFAARWKLLDRLHPNYSDSGNDDAVIAVSWLNEEAAFESKSNAETEISAFAEHFGKNKLEIEDSDLRELRNRFDELSDGRCEELGREVGSSLLLDGFVYKDGKVQRQKVSPREAYLCKTLDSDSPLWPTAAATLPGIKWIQARYSDQLKSGATRYARKRADGTISRGPRKFLMLLGAEVAPRLEEVGLVRGGGATRMRDLRAVGAEQVGNDYVSRDLERVLSSYKKASKKELRIRSPALFKALAKAWDRLYADRQMVGSQHVARVYTYPKASVTADWLLNLRETPWIAVGKGELSIPGQAVIKTTETQSLYGNSDFVIDVSGGDFSADFAASLGLITTVRVSDLIATIQDIRDGTDLVQSAQVMLIYRNIAKQVPKVVAWNTKIGDLTAQEMKARFSEGRGLIYAGGDVWRRPTDLLRGQDIFHDRSKFVPGGPALPALWAAVGVREPSLDDCLQYLKGLAGSLYSVDVISVWIDVFRYIEPLLEKAERRHKDRLKALPLYCGDTWHSERPIVLVEDSELRGQLSKALPKRMFWTPPCDMRELPTLVSLLGVTPSEPTLRVVDSREPAEMHGEAVRQRFVRAVDHLSNELAVNDPGTRQRMSIGWQELRDIRLFVYPGPIAVRAEDENIIAGPVAIELQALVTADVPSELHVWEEALAKREYCGHAIASLFPVVSRRRIEAEWVVAWQESQERAAAVIHLASDEEHEEAMHDRAAKINSLPKKKTPVSQPGGRGQLAKPRSLKEQVGAILGATIVPGNPPKPSVVPAKPKLHDQAPSKKPISSTLKAGPTSYTIADLEQRGWELLVQALETSADEALIDFRNRRGVGADGVIDWKTFVEMKATGRSPQSSIEMSNAEYDRAKQRGNDFILALVSGLEEDYPDEVRLIFDPANRVTVRPLNGVKLVALAEAPSILITFGDADLDSND